MTDFFEESDVRVDTGRKTRFLSLVWFCHYPACV